MFVPAMIVAGAVLTTARSARVLTVVVVVALLLPATGSVVAPPALAVLDRVVASGTAAFTWAMIVNVAEAPDASVAMVSLTALPALPRVNAGPLAWFWETNEVPAGRVSASATDWASLGPLLVTVTV